MDADLVFARKTGNVQGAGQRNQGFFWGEMGEDESITFVTE